MSACREIRRLLVVQPVNWSADEWAQVDAHLATCPDCAALNRVYAEQDRSIRGLPSARLTPSQRGQFLSKIQLERRRHTMYTKLSAVAGVVAAVVIIIGIGFGTQTLLPPNTTPVSPSESLEPEVKVTEEPLLEWTFGGEIRLVKRTDPHPFLGIPNPTDPTKPGSVVPPTTVQISLGWELLAQPTANWVAFVHLVDETGAMVAQSDVPLDPPVQQCEPGTRDLDCRFFSEHEIALPGDTGAHLCTIEVGIYNQDTGERALVTSDRGEQNTATLGQVNIVGREPAVDGMSRGYFEWPVIPHDDLKLTFHDPRKPDHPAIDIAATEGTPITTADGGVASFAGWDDEGYGYLVVVEHNDGWTSLYAHLSEISVEAGQTLRQGDLLGKAGATGAATGPHLHFELRHWNQPVDPLSYLPPSSDPQPTEAPLPTPFPTETPVPLPTENCTGKAPIPIVYVRDGNLWLQTPDKPDRQLTSGGTDYEPSFSPDGTKVLFKRLTSSSPTDCPLYELRVVNADGSGERLVMAMDDLPDEVGWFDLTWHPDNQTLALSTGFECGRGAFNDDLWTVDTETVAVNQLLVEGEGGAFSLSPDGTRIMVSSSTRVMVMDADGGNRRTLLTFDHVPLFDGIEYHPQPAWAPDGSYALVAIPSPDVVAAPPGTASTVDLWQLPLDGEPILLTTLSDVVLYLGEFLWWSPDREHVAYVRDDPEQDPNSVGDLVIAKWDGSDPTVHTTGVDFLGWSTAGHRFAFAPHPGTKSYGYGAIYLGQVDSEMVSRVQAKNEPGRLTFFKWIDGETFAYWVGEELSDSRSLAIGRIDGTHYTPCLPPVGARYSSLDTLP
jgi:hypothetical protein